MDLIEETNELLFEVRYDKGAFLPRICQHCAHWDLHEETIGTGWGFCLKLWSDEEDSGQVGETGPRFGCVHYETE